MLKIRTIIVISLAAVGLMLSTGCDSYADKKQAAHLRWEEASARAKVPVALDLFENGRVDDAEKLLNECIEVDPLMPEAHLLMGRIHLLQARFDSAEQSFQKVVEYDEELHQGWYCLGLLAQQNNDLQRAQNCYRKAMSLKPANVDYIVAAAETLALQDDFDQALSLLESKDKELGGGELKVAIADILLRHGNTDEAIKLYNQILLLKSGDSREVTETMGYCYIMDQQWDQAAKMFDRLADEAEGSREQIYLELLAMCSMNDGQYGKAVGYFDRLSVKRRDDAQLWLQMGQAALGAGAAERAQRCAQKALSLRPAWSDAVALFGCGQYFKGNYKGSIRTFKKITSDRKTGGFAWFMTARCYQQLGQVARAEKGYKNASRLDPENKLVAAVTKSR